MKLWNANNVVRMVINVSSTLMIMDYFIFYQTLVCVSYWPSKSTSPTILNLPVFLSLILLMPISMTATPGLTMSAVMRPGMPVATTRMSAVFVNTFNCSAGV